MHKKNQYSIKKNKFSAALILENGDIYWGFGLGAEKTVIAELCFNTSITGYQEILTDPSYAKQIITFTFPHIGIVGTNKNDYESSRPFASGCVISEEIGKEDLSALIHLINYYKEDVFIGTIMAKGVGQLIDYFLKTNQKSKLERLLDDLGQDISSEILRQKLWIIRYINDDYAKLNTH